MILLQMEQGKLNVTDKVSKYLKEFQIKEYENITIHQLLNHTSGLNMMGGKLMFKSGTDFYYSNDGFNALGKIVETVSGKSYDDNALELFKRQVWLIPQPEMFLKEQTSHPLIWEMPVTFRKFRICLKG